MYFNAAFQDLGEVASDLMTSAVQALSNLTDDDYTYRDYNVKEIKESWLRIDFAREPASEHLKPIYHAFSTIAEHIVSQYKLPPVSNISLSQLRPLQILEEHVDGRFIHKITDRYLIPLSNSSKNYNYGYFKEEKIIYPLQYGRIYRINNSIVHSAVNLENDDRYNILIDVMEPRLRSKFSKHPDLFRSLNALAVNWNFEERLRIKKKMNLR